jgi:class 3 adenylate cyclase
MSEEIISVSGNPELVIKNDSDQEKLFIIENLAWSNKSVTAAEVIALQAFRDLFADEALRPGQQISVGSLTVVFTDLLASTKLYLDVGDAQAFGQVMSHFDVLREAVVAEDGALIKTIGDAVFAVFPSPVNALRALIKAQQELRNYIINGKPLYLKAGIHFGSSIAVTLNERLDYFGSTINLASRLVELSSGRDIILSERVRNDPEINDLLSEPEYRQRVTEHQAILKGFEDQPLLYWKIAT